MGWNKQEVLTNLKVGNIKGGDYIEMDKYGRIMFYGNSYIDSPGQVFCVDGTEGVGDDDFSGKNFSKPFALIQHAIDEADPYATIFVKQKLIPIAEELGGPGTDPNSYAENLIIPNDKPHLLIVGVSRGRTQGGLPQIKKGSGSNPLLTVRSAGCLLAGLGVNGSGSTGGGILLDDDGGASKAAFGTTIVGCHFKNCKGSNALSAATGGAIQWSSNGGAWQALIQGNRFYKNVGDIVLIGTGVSVPQDIIIEKNVFSGPAADVDCNLYLKGGGSGINGVVIDDNIFPALPALSSGVKLRFIDATGCIGVLSNNKFADTTTATGYGAAKAKAMIPITMFMIKNYNESGLITREA